jgi:hypothetical protein
VQIETTVQNKLMGMFGLGRLNKMRSQNLTTNLSTLSGRGSSSKALSAAAGRKIPATNNLKYETLLVPNKK